MHYYKNAKKWHMHGTESRYYHYKNALLSLHKCVSITKRCYTNALLLLARPSCELIFVASR